MKLKIKEAKNESDSIYKIHLKTFTIRKYRIAEPKEEVQPDVAFKIAKQIYKNLDADQEHLTILFLDDALHINGFKVLFNGTMESALIDLRIIFRSSLLFGAEKIILIHNHPNNNLRPSEEDDYLTKKVAEAGELLNVRLIDHIIIGDSNEEYYSYRKKSNPNLRV